MKTKSKKSKKRQEKSWVEKMLENKRFKAMVEKELDALSIGENLLQLRLKSGLTQAQVAKKAGTTASAISRYENAEYDRYEMHTLRKIAKACGGCMKIVFESASDEDEAA